MKSMKIYWNDSRIRNLCIEIYWNDQTVTICQKSHWYEINQADIFEGLGLPATNLALTVATCPSPRRTPKWNHRRRPVDSAPGHMAVYWIGVHSFIYSIVINTLPIDAIGKKSKRGFEDFTQFPAGVQGCLHKPLMWYRVATGIWGTIWRIRSQENVKALGVRSWFADQISVADRYGLVPGPWGKISPLALSKLLMNSRPPYLCTSQVVQMRSQSVDLSDITWNLTISKIHL